MAGDEDIGLPPVPPPAPARREAAIEAAMRRFDGVPEPQVAPVREGVRRGSVWGVLVAASLVLLVGVPSAWLALRDGRAPEAMAPRVVMKDEVAAPVTVAMAPPAQVTVRKPAVTGIDAAPAAPPVMAPEVREERLADNAMVPMAAPPPPPPPPPPPAPVMAEMAPAAKLAGRAAAADESLVVTAQRVRRDGYAARGDWNACTIDDPRRSLAACRGAVDPGAAGVRGQADAFVAEGLTQGWQGEDARAVAAFDRAVELAPKSAGAWLNRGLAKARLGDDDGALADVSRAVKLAPHSARAHFARGRLLRARGDERGAEAEFARAAEIDPAYDTLAD